MRYEYILFDLDGTLTDSGTGIINSVKYALEKFHIGIKDLCQLRRFIGPPLIDSFREYYGFTEEQAITAVEYYREYYKEKGIFENSVYHGVENLLRELKEQDRIIILATSKPEVFAKQILVHFDLARYFTYVAGSNLDGTRVKKSEVIKYALDSCAITDLSKAIMVGDREHDIIGAKQVGIDSVGVLFGYGDRSELEKADADYIAETVEDIRGII